MWPVVHFFFRICPMPNAVSVGIWIPSSASTPQVGFMSMTTSSTPEEKSKSQGRRRRRMEVPCLGLWHDFKVAAGSGRSTLGSEIEKN